MKYFILSSMEILSFFIIWGNIDSKYENKIWGKSIIIIILSAMCVILDYYSISIGFIINYLTMCSMVIVIFRIPLKEMFFDFLIAFAMIMGIQMSTIYIFEIFENSFSYNFINGLLINSIVIIGCRLICKWCFIKKLKIELYKYYRTFGMIGTNILGLMLSILYLWDHSKDWIVDYLPLILIFTFIWISINFYILYQAMQIKKREDEIRVHQRYLPFLSKLVDEVRKTQHDYKNHLNTIYGLTEIKDSKIAQGEIRNYLKGVIQEIKPVDQILSIRDPILSAIIYSKKSLAESKGIEFEVQILNEIPSYPLESHELVEVLGNLLDNAIEAVEGSDGNNSKVILTLGIDKESQLIEIKNTGVPIETKNIEYIFQKGFSTKKGKHRGYGLYNVNQVINKYSGTIELSFENQYTSFKVLL